MESQPLDTVERVFLVSGQRDRYVNRIFALLFGWRAVVMRTAQLQDTCEPVSPSWLDLAQDG
jgi:hypothetical protein